MHHTLCLHSITHIKMSLIPVNSSRTFHCIGCSFCLTDQFLGWERGKQKSNQLIFIVTWPRSGFKGVSSYIINTFLSCCIHVHLTTAVDQGREIVEHMLESKWATALTHIGVYTCVWITDSLLYSHMPLSGFEILTCSKKMDVASHLLFFVLEMVSLWTISHRYWHIALVIPFWVLWCLQSRAVILSSHITEK